jgi:hypothetical protein
MLPVEENVFIGGAGLNRSVMQYNKTTKKIVMDYNGFSNEIDYDFESSSDWILFALVENGNNTDIYTDGTTLLGTFNKKLSDATVERIGCGVSNQTTKYCNCFFDNVRFYSRSLTTGERNAIYNLEKTNAIIN